MSVDPQHPPYVPTLSATVGRMDIYFQVIKGIPINCGPGDGVLGVGDLEGVFEELEGCLLRRWLVQALFRLI